MLLALPQEREGAFEQFVPFLADALHGRLDVNVRLDADPLELPPIAVAHVSAGEGGADAPRPHAVGTFTGQVAEIEPLAQRPGDEIDCEVRLRIPNPRGDLRAGMIGWAT